MGIPGLATAAKKHLQSVDRDFLKSGVFYVDGLNFLGHVINPLSDDSKKTGIYNDLEKRLVQSVRTLLRLRPSKLYFYFDAMIPKGKINVRLSRKSAKLKHVAMRQAISASDLAITFLAKHFEFITVVYSGMEAEDEIAQDIYDTIMDGDPKRQKYFIFSNDSDLFRFQMPDASRIYIVPMGGGSLHPQKINLLNLGTLMEKNIVPRKFKVTMPVAREGIRIIASPGAQRGILEFINAGLVSNEFNAFLPALSVPTEDMRPFDAGLDIRRAAYGVIFERNFNGKTLHITEYGQRGSVTDIQSRTPIMGKDLQNVLMIFKTHPIEDIIENQLEEAAPKMGVSNQAIMSTIQYIKDLKANKPRPLTQKLHPEARILDVLLKVILTSIHMLEGAISETLDDAALLWKVSPYFLSSYML